MNIRQIIRNCREIKGISLAKLSEKTGFTKRAIEYWESGEHRISFEAAEKILDALGYLIEIKVANGNGDLVSRQYLLDEYDRQHKGPHGGARKIIEKAPAACISEEYARAVRNWLVNYQVKCAELKGRYTPYEVLGWIVSDWRKENGIW